MRKPEPYCIIMFYYLCMLYVFISRRVSIRKGVLKKFFYNCLQYDS